MLPKLKFLALISSLFICLVAVSCDNETPDPEKTIFDTQGENGFVGTLDGTNAFIAVMVTNNEALVYVCNGDEEIHEWFQEAITDPENINIQNSAGARVVGTFASSMFSGTVKLPDGSSHAFTASANTGNETGVFQVFGDLAEQEGVSAAWVLDATNEERGSFRWNSVFQTTPKKPSTSTFQFRNNSFPIRRFAIYHPDSISVAR